MDGTEAAAAAAVAVAAAAEPGPTLLQTIRANAAAADAAAGTRTYGENEYDAYEKAFYAAVANARGENLGDDKDDAIFVDDDDERPSKKARARKAKNALRTTNSSKMRSDAEVNSLLSSLVRSTTVSDQFIPRLGILPWKTERWKSELARRRHAAADAPPPAPDARLAEFDLKEPPPLTQVDQFMDRAMGEASADAAASASAAAADVQLLELDLAAYSLIRLPELKKAPREKKAKETWEKMVKEKNVHCYTAQRFVVPFEDLFACLYWTHTQSHVHTGSTKLWEYCRLHYYGVQQNICRIFMDLCGSCKRTHTNDLSKKMIPIVSSRFLERVQFDLIDMSRHAFNGFKYILTCKDHFTRWVWLYRLKDRDAGAIAKCMIKLIRFNGKFELWHTDNGSEFIGPAATIVAAQFGIELAHGQPHASNVQGSVENANKTVEYRLLKLMHERGEDDCGPA